MDAQELETLKKQQKLEQLRWLKTKLFLLKKQEDELFKEMAWTSEEYQQLKRELGK